MDVDKVSSNFMKSKICQSESLAFLWVEGGDWAEWMEAIVPSYIGGFGRGDGLAKILDL